MSIGKGKRWLALLALLFLLGVHLHPVCRVTVGGEALAGRFSPAQIRLAQRAARAAAEEILDRPTALIRPRCFYRLSLRAADGDPARLCDALLRRADGIVLADGVSVNGTALGTVTDGTLLLERLYEAMRGDMPETATVARLGGNLQIHRVYSRAGHESPVWDMVLRVTGAAPVFYLDGEGKVV